MTHFPRRASFSLVLLALFCLAVSSGAQAQVLSDNFDDNSIDSTLWMAHAAGGPQVVEANHRLELSFPASSAGEIFGAGLESRFLLAGDFDVRVDFQLLEWPYASGVRSALGTDHPAQKVERTSFGSSVDHSWAPREVYLTDFADGVQGVIATTDQAGSLRLTRTAGLYVGYYRQSGDWVPIHESAGPEQDFVIGLDGWSHDWAFMNVPVMMAFDAFEVMAGQVIWPECDVPAHSFRNDPPPFVISPNPASASMLIRSSSPLAGDRALEFYDATGRLLRTFEWGRADGWPSAVRWDLRDATGHPVPSGQYYCIERSSQGRSQAARLLIVR